MANHKSAIKRFLQSEKKRIFNRIFKSKLNTQYKKSIKEIKNSVCLKNAIEVRKRISLLAKAGKKGILHKKNASRKISRIMKKIKN